MTEITAEETLKPFGDMGLATEIGLYHLRKNGGQNEDTATVIPGIGAVLSDGMGGHANGKAASEEITGKLVSFLRDSQAELNATDNELHVTAMVQSAIDIVHRDMLTHGDKRGGTVCLVVNWHDKVIIAWAGDSRVYRQRGDAVELMTTDNSHFIQQIIENDGGSKKRANQIQSMIDQGYPEKDILKKLTKKYEEAYYYHRNGIKRCIGGRDKNLLDIVIAPSCEPEVMTVDRKKGDRLILMSDGPPANITPATMTDILRSNKTSQDAADALLERAVHQRSTTMGHDDDLTVVVVGDEEVKSVKRARPPKAQRITEPISTVKATSNPPREAENNIPNPDWTRIIDTRDSVNISGKRFRKGEFITIRYPTPYDPPQKMYIGDISGGIVSMSFTKESKFQMVDVPISRVEWAANRSEVIPVIDERIGMFSRSASGEITYRGMPIKKGQIFIGKPSLGSDITDMMVVMVLNEGLVIQSLQEYRSAAEELRGANSRKIRDLHMYLFAPADEQPDDYLSPHEASLFSYIEERLGKAVQAGEPKENLQTMRLSRVSDARRMSALLQKREEYRQKVVSLTKPEEEGRREYNLQRYLILSALMKYSFVNRNIMEDYMRQALSDRFQSEDTFIAEITADTFNQAWQIVNAYATGAEADVMQGKGLSVEQADATIGARYQEALYNAGLYTEDELWPGK